jgi:hypothetical protein
VKEESIYFEFYAATNLQTSTKYKNLNSYLNRNKQT